MRDSYYSLSNKGIYETYDYAEFLKNNEEFKESIKYYTEILKNIPFRLFMKKKYLVQGEE